MNTEFILTADDERVLGTLIGACVRQIVWDLNALYLVVAENALKVEVVAEVPPVEVRTDQYDEVVYVQLKLVMPAPTFRDEGEEGFWYKVVACREEIRAVEIARTTVWYRGTIRPPGPVAGGDERCVIADVGVVITLSSGVIPAVVRDNSFGFATWPEIRIYSREELPELLGSNYELRAVQPAA